MGRPLRAVYANSTYSTGVQEMSDSDIDSICGPIILSYIVNNPTLTYGTTLRINTAGVYDVSRGSVTDTRNGNIGDHPVSNTVITTYTLYQNERAVSPLGVTARPVHYVASGSEHRISEMTDSDIVSFVANSIVQTMISGGQGGYYLGLTTDGPPATGTWVSYATLSDTYYNPSSALTTETYTLWQRTTGTLQGTIRPLKITGTNSLIEMTDSEIQSMSACVGEYIRTTGIGQYALQTSMPGTGTWANRGSFVDKVNNLVDTAYAGVYNSFFNAPFTGTFTNNYTGQWTGQFTQGFTGTYIGSYAQPFTGQFTQNYSQTYTGLFTMLYTGLFTGSYAGGYGQMFTQAYVGAYADAYSQQYTGSYLNNFTNLYTNQYTFPYTGQFTQNYSRAFTGAYAGTYNRAYSQNYSKQYTGQYAGLFTGQWTNSWTGTYTGAWTGQYQGAYAGAYQGTSYAAAVYNAIYTRYYLGIYTHNNDVAFTRVTTNYTGTYSTITRLGPSRYTGIFTGSQFTGAFVNTAYVENYTLSFTRETYTNLAVATATGYVNPVATTMTFAGNKTLYTKTYTGSLYTTGATVYTGNRLYNIQTNTGYVTNTLNYTVGEVAYAGTYRGPTNTPLRPTTYGLGAGYTADTLLYTRTAYTGAIIKTLQSTYGTIHMSTPGVDATYFSLPFPDIGTGAFTLEFYFKFTVLPSGNWYILLPEKGTGTPLCVSVNGPLGRVNQTGFGSSPIVDGVTLTNWTHVAITRNDKNTTSFWVNGTLIGSSNVFFDLLGDNILWGLLPGGNSSNPRPQADFAYFRFVLGTEEYTTNFTPPTSPNLTLTDKTLYLVTFESLYPALDTYTNVDPTIIINKANDVALNLVDPNASPAVTRVLVQGSPNNMLYQDHTVGTPWSALSLPMTYTTLLYDSTVGEYASGYGALGQYQPVAVFTTQDEASRVYSTTISFGTTFLGFYGTGTLYTAGTPNQRYTSQDRTSVYNLLYTGQATTQSWAPIAYRSGIGYAGIYGLVHALDVSYTGLSYSQTYTSNYVRYYTGGLRFFTGTRALTWTAVATVYTNPDGSVVYTGRRIDSAVWNSASVYAGTTYTGTIVPVWQDINKWTNVYTTSDIPYVTSYGSPVFTAQAGTFTGTFTGVSFAGIYAGAYTKNYTSNAFTATFTGTYVGGYGVAPYSTPFVGAYQGAYSKQYTQLYAGAYTGQWTGQWTQAYVGSYEGAYGSAVFNTTYQQAFTGQWTNQWTQLYTGAFAGAYTGQWTGQWTGTYNTAYSGTFTGTYAGSYANQWTATYANAFTQAYTILYNRGFTGLFTGAYVGSYSGQFTQEFTQVYAGLYNNAFTGTFTSAYTKEFSGLTTQATTTSITYTLWVRTA